MDALLQLFVVLALCWGLSEMLTLRFDVDRNHVSPRHEENFAKKYYIYAHGHIGYCRQTQHQ